MAGNPMAENPQMAAAGLANLAHAVRRSTALYVAMSITPPESSVEDLLVTAERLAVWVNGRAGAAAPPAAPGYSEPPREGQSFLGLDPWA